MNNRTDLDLADNRPPQPSHASSMANTLGLTPIQLGQPATPSTNLSPIEPLAKAMAPVSSTTARSLLNVMSPNSAANLSLMVPSMALLTELKRSASVPGS